MTSGTYGLRSVQVHQMANPLNRLLARIRKRLNVVLKRSVHTGVSTQFANSLDLRSLFAEPCGDF